MCKDIDIVGIIPAAGSGSRWGGYYKELLPTKTGEWLIDRAIRSMKIANRIIIITNDKKISAHASHLADKYDDVAFVTQKEGNDIMGAIRSSYPFLGDYNLFAMPDTYYDIGVFDRMDLDKAHFYLGTHTTVHPDRFGIIQGKQVINKSPSLAWGKRYTAWGTLAWSKYVTQSWRLKNIKDYTTAINYAMRTHKYRTVPMKYYFDMATYKDYQDFSCKGL